MNLEIGGKRRTKWNSVFKILSNMDAKYVCRFCGRTNTKIEPITRGLFGVKVGEQEVVDKSETFYRCAYCGVIMCKNCCNKQDVFKKKIGVFSTKYWTECPKCDSKMIEL